VIQLCKSAEPIFLFLYTNVQSGQYNLMDIDQQCHLLDTICLLPCAATRNLDFEGVTIDAEYRRRCRICDRRSYRDVGATSTTWNEVVPCEEYQEILLFLSALVEDPSFRRTRKPRVLAAHAIRRVIRHLSDGDYLSLGAGVLAPWLMRSLQSSVRELRIASAYVQQYSGYLK
jgi:serine/threonine-protein kinase ATR